MNSPFAPTPHVREKEYHFLARPSAPPVLKWGEICLEMKSARDALPSSSQADQGR